MFVSLWSLQNSITLQHDPGTSDDSGRASERLTTSSVAPRDADSSRDRLSDVSKVCHYNNAIEVQMRIINSFQHFAVLTGCEKQHRRS